MTPAKKQAILQIAVRLIGEGRDPLTLRIAEVARLAGTGKGTVYEYFSSKQDMIMQSYIFALRQILADMRAAERGVADFKGKLRAMLQALNGKMDSHAGILDAMVRSHQLGGIEKSRVQEYVEPIMAQLRELFFEVLDVGVREGVIAQGHTPFECECAIKFFVMTLLDYRQNARRHPDCTMQQVIDFAVHALIAILR